MLFGLPWEHCIYRAAVVLGTPDILCSLSRGHIFRPKVMPNRIQQQQ